MIEGERCFLIGLNNKRFNNISVTFRQKKVEQEMSRLCSLRFVASLCHCSVYSTVLLLPGTAEAEQAAVKLTENAQSLFVITLKEYE